MAVSFVAAGGACSSSSGPHDSAADAGGATSSSDAVGSSDSNGPGASTGELDGGTSSMPPASGAPADGGAPTEPTEPEQDGGTTDGSGGDTGSEADGGGPDGGPPLNPWAGCPTEASADDPAWDLTLRATTDATYCATFNESRTLKEEQLVKAQLRLAPGAYRLPRTGTEQVALPWCLRDETSAKGVTAGQVMVTQTPIDPLTNYNVVMEQAFDATSGQRLRVALDQGFEDGASAEFVLDGTESSGFDSYQSFELCTEDGEYCFPDVIFTSCAYESGELNTHTVEFEGGEVVFELRLGDSFAGTEPGAFVAARGRFRGETFEQEDYFKLIYHPTHHHFERTFVVLFDEPRGDVCGIEVGALEPFGDDVPDAAFTVDCELNHLQELQVTSHSLLRGSP